MDLLHHSATGWLYSPGSFVAGDGTIASFNTDLAPYDILTSNDEFAWKRTNLNKFVAGSSSEGIMFRMSPSGPNSISSMDLHISGVIEQLVF